MNVNVNIVVAKDGKTVKIETAQNGKLFSLPIPAEYVGTFVAGLLAGAVNCAKKSGAGITPFSQTRDRAKLVFAHANGVALCETETPGVVGMVFAFGATELNIGLSREALKPLGSALWADSAGGQLQ